MRQNRVKCDVNTVAKVGLSATYQVAATNDKTRVLYHGHFCSFLIGLSRSI